MIINRTKRTSALVFIGLSILILVIEKFPPKDFFSSGTKSSSIDDGLNRNPDQVIYTKHAKCRMGCRFFTKEEVLEILANGEINPEKSNPNDQPCPTYAVEGRTSDQQLARMVFASCGDEIKVITCIDLEEDYSCDCY